MQKKYLTYQGGLLIILTTLCFTATDAQVKFFGNHFSVLDLVWAKYFGQFFFLSFIFLRSRKNLLQYGNLKLQILRGVCTICPTFLFFYGLQFVPLAEATAIAFLHPLVVVILSAIFFKQVILKKTIFIIVLGFIGVLIITRPGLGVIHPASFIIILSSLFFSVYQLLSEHLMRISNAITTLFYTTLVGVVISSVFFLFSISNLSLTILIILISFGFLCSIGEYCLILAYKNDNASFLTPLFYLGLVWNTLYGFFLFNELPDIFSIIGTLMLVSAGLLSFHFKKN